MRGGCKTKMQLTFCVNLTVAIVNFLYVGKMICDSRVSWIVYKWEIAHCMQVYWPSSLKCCFCYLFTIIINGIVFGVR